MAKVSAMMPLLYDRDPTIMVETPQHLSEPEDVMHPMPLLASNATGS
jgi:hypothetical protein